MVEDSSSDGGDASARSAIVYPPNKVNNQPEEAKQFSSSSDAGDASARSAIVYPSNNVEQFEETKQFYSDHSSIHEDVEEVPKFVPKTQEATGGLILKRKTTLRAN